MELSWLQNQRSIKTGNYEVTTYLCRRPNHPPEPQITRARSVDVRVSLLVCISTCQRCSLKNKCDCIVWKSDVFEHGNGTVKFEPFLWHPTVESGESEYEGIKMVAALVHEICRFGVK